MNTPTSMRLDKWLWSARFFKTRSLASHEISNGRVEVNAQTAKASRELKIGDALQLRQGNVQRSIIVTGLSLTRGSATVAQSLFEETAASIAARQQAAAQRRLAPEPAASQAQGRPTKRDRRQLEQAKQRHDDAAT